MNANPARVAASLCSVVLAWAACIAAVPVIAADASRLGDDPRVRDAFALWTEWVEYQARLQRVPGMSLGVVHDQEILGTYAFGYANPEAEIPATADTLYSICSISKLFTAVGIMQQREEGRLRLDDPVSAHLDWYNIENLHPAGEPVTIRSLLSHSAGLPRESDFPYWTETDHPFPTREQLRQRLGEQQTLYPGSRYFQYSNLGITLAGEILVERAGQSFDSYIRARILEPLGMRDTHTDIPLGLHGNRMAVGHAQLGRDGTRQPVGPFQTRSIAPAAGFASSVNDLARFAMWQSRVLASGGDEVLRAASLREMHRPHWVDPDWNTFWGLGFGIARENNRTFVRHSGGCPGYFSEFRLEPSSKLAAIVLSNAIGTEVRFYAARAFDLVGPAVASALAAPDHGLKRDPALDRYTGVYGTMWGEVAVARWGDGLALLSLGSRDPASALEQLEQVGEHRFRRVRQDDGSPGEEIFFEVAPDGSVHRFQRHSGWEVKRR